MENPSLFEGQPLIEEKRRRYSETLQKLHPWLRKESDPSFAKHAHRMAYAGEIMFTLFSVLVIIELFVTNPTAIVTLESLRLAGMTATAFLTAFNLYKGYGFPTVNIKFYLAELLIALAINIAAIVVTSSRLSNKFKSGQPWTWSDAFAIAVPAGFTAFNFYLLGKETYRAAFLKKKTTPINSVFTLLMAVFILGFSGLTISKNAKLLKE